MKESSANALLAFSIILLLPGMMIISPDGRLVCLILAGICALLAAIGGKTKGKKIAAIAVFAVIFGLAISTYSEFRTFYDGYRERVGRHK